MSRKKRVKIKRIDADTLRPKRVKPFNTKRFLKMAKELQKAIEKEERAYGPMVPNPQFS